MSDPKPPALPVLSEAESQRAFDTGSEFPMASLPEEKIEVPTPGYKPLDHIKHSIESEPINDLKE